MLTGFLQPDRRKLVQKGAAGKTGLEELRQANLWKKGEDAMKEAASAVSQ